MIYKPGIQEGPFVVTGIHDPDNVRPMQLQLKPPVWTADTIYKWFSKDRYDVVIPSDFVGLYHRVVNPGKSHATTEPNFAATIGGITEDFRAGKTEGLTWEALPYDFILAHDEDMSSITPTLTNGVTLDSSAISGGNIDFMIGDISPTAAARESLIFQVSFHIVTPARELDLSLEFNLGEW